MTKQKLAAVGAALIVFAIAMSTAKARTIPAAEFDRHASDGRGFVSPQREARRVHHKRDRRLNDRPAIPKNYATNEPQVVGHPVGCPSSRFCGCGTCLYLLGKPCIRGGLAIASNWLHLPRATCAPRMAAARPGHVFAIIECLDGNRALAYDPNSGGHRTHIHVRSLAGYKVVDPGGSRYAAAQ